MDTLQQQLLEDGCFIPGMNRPLSGNVTFELPDEAAAVLNNGWDRPHEGVVNRVLIADGEALELNLKTPAAGLRLALDPDFSRDSISGHAKYQKYAMRTHIDENTAVSMPENLLKACTVIAETADGKLHTQEILNNRQALRYISLPGNTCRVRLEKLQSWGGSETGFFSCDTI